MPDQPIATHDAAPLGFGVPLLSILQGCSSSTKNVQRATAELSDAQVGLPFLDEVIKNNTIIDSSSNGVHTIGGDYPYWIDTPQILLANGLGPALAHEGVHDHFLRNLGTDELLTERFESTMASMKEGEFVSRTSSDSGGLLQSVHADYTDDCAMEAYAAYVENAVSNQIGTYEALVYNVYNEPGAADILKLEKAVEAQYEQVGTQETLGRVIGKGYCPPLDPAGRAYADEHLLGGNPDFSVIRDRALSTKGPSVPAGDPLQPSYEP